MKYVGIKQVLKAVEEGSVKTVYIGDDAEEHVTEQLIKMCEEKNIVVKHISTMEELGRLAGIDVKASAAAE